mmetsp:Transcript_47359/g.60827  ORF Transcript_47359/g.60827 Transcript_47359/m.60827 type:complete len:156 (+) Transcript_47359:477-944(+)
MEQQLVIEPLKFVKIRRLKNEQQIKQLILHQLETVDVLKVIVKMERIQMELLIKSIIKKAGNDKTSVFAAEQTPNLNLYVNNLNWNSTDDDLFQHFCSAGVTPTSAKVQMNQTNGRSRGWGLVSYNSIEDAERALKQLNKTILDERKISVRFDVK